MLQGPEPSPRGGDGAAGAEEGPRWPLPRWKADGDMCPRKKTPAGSKDCICDQFVSLPREKKQLSASQCRVPDCEGAPLALRPGRRSSSQGWGGAPGCPSHPTAHHCPLGPPHHPPIPTGISRQVFPWGAGSRGGRAPSKSQQRTRRLFRIERRSLVCSTSCEMKIHPKCKFGPLKRRM